MPAQPLPAEARIEAHWSNENARRRKTTWCRLVAAHGTMPSPKGPRSPGPKLWSFRNRWSGWPGTNDIQWLAHHNAHCNGEVLGDYAERGQNATGEEGNDDEKRRPALDRHVGRQFFINDKAGNGSGQNHRAESHQRDQSQWTRASGKDQVPEMAEQLDIRISRGPPHFAPQSHGRMTDACGNPKQAHVQVDAIATVSCQGPCNLAIHEAKAVEPADL